jgi:hypothetical protein
MPADGELRRSLKERIPIPPHGRRCYDLVVLKWVVIALLGALAVNVLGGLIVARAATWNGWVLLCFGMSALFAALGFGILMHKKEAASATATASQVPPSVPAPVVPSPILPIAEARPVAPAPLPPSGEHKKAAHPGHKGKKMATNDDEKPGLEEVEVVGDNKAGDGGKGSHGGGVGGKGGALGITAPKGTKKLIIRGNQTAGNGGDANGGKGGDGGPLHIGAEQAPPGQDGTSIEIRPPDPKK